MKDDTDRDEQAARETIEDVLEGRFALGSDDEAEIIEGWDTAHQALDVLLRRIQRASSSGRN